MNNLLVIGGAGSIGTAFIKKMLDHYPSVSVCVFSRSELHHHEVKQKLAKFKDRIGTYLGDIKDIDSIRKCVRATNPSHIIVTAAIKRIEVCESNPVEALMVNAVGIENVCRVAVESDSVQTVLYTSTDKASDPVGVYGNTKAIAEAIIRNYAKTFPNKKFITTRFANVLNSNGSVIPIFRNLLKNNTPLTIRGAEMTRYFLSEQQAAEVIWHALAYCDNGNILVPRCSAMKIVDLAEIMIQDHGRNVGIKVVEPLPYEKLHEVLVSKNGLAHLKKEIVGLGIPSYFMLDLDLQVPAGEEVLSNDPRVLLTKDGLREVLIGAEIVLP